MGGNNWERVPVSHVADIYLGGTPKRSEASYWNGGILWASAKDIANNPSRYLLETEETISELGLNNSAAKLLEKDTILITARGTVGAISMLGRPMSFNQTNYGLVAKPKVIDPTFLYYALKLSFDNIQSLTYGTIFDTITMKSFDALNIPLPPLAEQRRIAHILGTLDDKIELNRRMNATLEAMARALFKSWFVDFDPVHAKAAGRRGGLPPELEALFPDSFVDSELGPIPRGWEVETLGDAIEIHDAKRIPLSSREREGRQGPYPYYGATSIMDFVDDYLFDGIYVLVGEDGSVVDESGHPVTQYVWGRFWVNNHAHVLRGKDGVSTEYLLLWLKQIYILPYITGAVQPKLNQANLKSIPFLKPTAKLMAAFDLTVSRLFTLLRSNKEQGDQLKQLRDHLLPQLVAGQPL